MSIIIRFVSATVVKTTPSGDGNARRSLGEKPTNPRMHSCETRRRHFDVTDKPEMSWLSHDRRHLIGRLVAWMSTGCRRTARRKWNRPTTSGEVISVGDRSAASGLNDVNRAKLCQKQDANRTNIGQFLFMSFTGNEATAESRDRLLRLLNETDIAVFFLTI